jgi:hypothetical protein
MTFFGANAPGHIVDTWKAIEPGRATDYHAAVQIGPFLRHLFQGTIVFTDPVHVVPPVQTAQSLDYCASGLESLVPRSIEKLKGSRGDVFTPASASFRGYSDIDKCGYDAFRYSNRGI